MSALLGSRGIAEVLAALYKLASESEGLMNAAKQRRNPTKTARTLHATIPAVLSAVQPLCHQARTLLQDHGQHEHLFAVDLLLREFLNNAIVHGNGEDGCKPVQVTVRIGHKRILLSIIDSGTGFDWRRQLSHKALPSATSGRGLTIGQQYAQRMRFNRAGNSVILAVSKTQTAYSHSS